jgi:hypothetical protein
MASAKLVEKSRRWFNSLTERRLQKHANANYGQHTRQLRSALKRTQTVLLKDSESGQWYEA